jgi:hypothetical protein
MSDVSILQSTQYTVKKDGLALVTKIGIIDLTGMFEELNIFDSIFNPCMTGTILIRDAKGLSNKLSFDGSEILLIEMLISRKKVSIQGSIRMALASRSCSLWKAAMSSRTNASLFM